MREYLKTTIEINDYLKKSDPVLVKIIDDNNLIERPLTLNYFESLLSSIVGQQLSNKVVDIIWRRLVAVLNNKLDPHLILATKDEVFREIGLSMRKIEYIKSLSEYVVDGTINLDDLDKLDNESIIELLTKIKGIGPWTAEMFLIFSLGREDIFSTRDGGLQRAVKNLYQFENNPSLEDLLQISKAWSPYRTYASFYLWDSLKSG